MAMKYTLVFLLGIVVGAFLFLGFSFFNEGNSFTGNVISNNAPGNWVSDEEIIPFDDYVLIRVNNATISSYEETGSMKPLFDFEANGIRIVPKNEDEIDVGDIVSFRVGKDLVVHRVVEKGYDSEGVYFLTQGDNSMFEDLKIRFKDIEYVTVAVIW